MKRSVFLFSVELNCFAFLALLALRNCTRSPEGDGSGGSLMNPTHVEKVSRCILHAAQPAVGLIANAWSRPPLLDWRSSKQSMRNIQGDSGNQFHIFMFRGSATPSLHSGSHSISTSLFSCHAVGSSQNQTLKTWNEGGFFFASHPARCTWQFWCMI